MNHILLQFLKDYLAWVESGAIEPNYNFSRNSGICPLLSKYLRRKYSYGVEFEIMRNLEILLENDFGSSIFPFNNNNRMDYFNEMYVLNAGHLNEKRINWIRRKIINA